VAESVRGPLRESVTIKVGSEAISGPSREEPVTESPLEPGIESISDSTAAEAVCPVLLAKASPETVTVRSVIAERATTRRAMRLAEKPRWLLEGVFTISSFE